MLLIPMGVAQSKKFAEVLDISFENRTCPEIRETGMLDFEYPKLGSTGGLLYGSIPFFCGGSLDVLSELDAIDACFTVVTYHNLIIEMPEARTFSASITTGHLDNTLFITGGFSLTGYRTNYFHKYDLKSLN